MRLITVKNAKTVKGEKHGWITGILYLAPHTTADPNFNVCPWSTPGCRKACLYTAGRGRMQSIQHARIKKTKWLIRDRESFIDQLILDINQLKKVADRKGMKLAIRLNGTSDLPWETKQFGQIHTRFPDIPFYDYTKSMKRVLDQTANYTLILSKSETNTEDCLAVLSKGHNVAAVFSTIKPLNTITWNGYKVIDGDINDLRFIEEKSVVVGLLAKGKAKYDTSGFVINYEAMD